MTTINIPVKIEYGAGSSVEIGEELKNRSCNKAFIITDAGVVKAGLLSKITESIDEAGIAYEVYDKVRPDPDISCVKEASDLYSKTTSDCMIAIGGGSAIDTAKGAAILASHPGDIMDYAGMDKIINPLPTLIAIPTTCGTGSEVTNVTVITDDNQFKTPFVSDELMPDVAILDPSLLYTLPQGLVASTGMDALTHAIEAYTNKTQNWFADINALQAIRDISGFIRPAALGGDKIALEKMQYASTVAGISFKLSRLGLVHAMSHPVSGVAKVPHGIANAVLLPYVMAFNLAGNPKAYSDVAQALGVEESGSTIDMAIQGVKKVVQLNNQLRIPHSFKDLGMNEEDIHLMVEDTMKSGNVLINTRRVQQADVVEIFKMSYQGESPLLLLGDM